MGKHSIFFYLVCLEDLSIVLIFYGDLFEATFYWTFGIFETVAQDKTLSHRFFMQETLLSKFPGLFMVSCTNNICDLNPTCIFKRGS